MTESPETFETYPYNSDGPSRPAGQDPPPAQLQPRSAPPAPIVSSPTGRSGIGRRAVVGFLAAVAVAVVGGAVINSATTPDYEEPWATMPAEEWTDEPTPGYAELHLDYTVIGVEVPVDWTVESDAGRLLLVTHEQGWLAARSPERAAATQDDLAREADYLRQLGGEFDPTGEPVVSDESDDRFTILVQTTPGRFGGAPATETVTLLVHPEQGSSLLISRVTVDAGRDATAQARGMERQLQRGFESL